MNAVSGIVKPIGSFYVSSPYFTDILVMANSKFNLQIRKYVKMKETQT